MVFLSNAASMSPLPPNSAQWVRIVIFIILGRLQISMVLFATGDAVEGIVKLPTISIFSSKCWIYWVINERHYPFPRPRLCSPLCQALCQPQTSQEGPTSKSKSAIEEITLALCMCLTEGWKNLHMCGRNKDDTIKK